MMMRENPKQLLNPWRMLLLFLYPLTLSGCGAAIVTGLGAMSFAGSEESHVEVESFENTTLDQAKITAITQIAISEFEGDFRGVASTLADRINDKQGSLRIVSPFLFSQAAGINPMQFRMPGYRLGEEDQVHLARTVAPKLNVEGILFGRIERQSIERPSYGEHFARSFAPKTEMPERLYVTLLSPEGGVIWSDEMPYTIVFGLGEMLSDEAIRTELCNRLIERFAEIGIMKGGAMKEPVKH